MNFTKSTQDLQNSESEVWGRETDRWDQLTHGTHATERQRQGRRSSPAKLDDGEVSVGSKGFYVFLSSRRLCWPTSLALYWTLGCSPSWMAARRRWGRYAGMHDRCRPGWGSRRASVSQGKAIGTRMRRNGGAERPGHVAGELVRNSDEGEWLGAWQCRLTHARQWPRRWRRGRGSFGGAFGGLAWPEAAREAQAKLPFRSGARRGEMEERERWGGEMRTTEARGGVVASKWRRRGWQVGSPLTYGRHGSSTCRPAGDWWNWIARFGRRHQWLKPDWRFTLSSIDGFGSDLILWIELHKVYKFAYKIKV